MSLRNVRKILLDSPSCKVEYDSLKWKKDLIIEIPNLNETSSIELESDMWDVHLYEDKTMYLYHNMKTRSYRFKIWSNNGTIHAELGRKLLHQYQYETICTYNVKTESENFGHPMDTTKNQFYMN
eukprot:gene11714-4948_t